MGILSSIFGGGNSKGGGSSDKGGGKAADFSPLFQQPPSNTQASNSSTQTSRFSNTRQSFANSKISSSGGLADKDSKLDTKTSQDYLFHGSSIERMKAMRFMGEKIRGNEKLKRRLQLDGDGLKKFLKNATGSGGYFRSETAKRDKRYLDEGKIEQTSFYQSASPNQQQTMRQDADTQKGLGKIYESMFKK